MIELMANWTSAGAWTLGRDPLDAALGFSAAETARLVRDCRKFAAQVVSVP